MKKTIVFLAFLFLVIAIAFFTNPTPSEHKAAVKEVLYEHLKKSMKTNFSDFSIDQNTGLGTGMMFGGALVEMLVENMVTSEDYYLFSVTQITWKNSTRTLGVGLFGRVMISDKLEEDLNSIFKDDQTRIEGADSPIDGAAIEEENGVEEAGWGTTLSQEEMQELEEQMEAGKFDPGFDPNEQE